MPLLLKRFAPAWLLASVVVFAAAPARAQMSGKPDAMDLSSIVYWQARVGKARPAADETIYVLVHSAKDCGYCTRWKKNPSGLANAKRMVDHFPKVRVFIVERDFLDDEERASQYPSDLQFEYIRRANEKELSPGVPLFEVFLGGKIIFRGGGLSTWVDRVLPAVVSLESRRDAARVAPVTEPAAPPP